MKRSIVGLGLALMVTGCYHATIETGAPPSQQVLSRSFASGWLWGLVPPSTLATQARCPAGVARVETQQSFVNQLVGFLTLGIYSPMSIKVTCAAQATGTARVALELAPIVPAARDSSRDAVYDRSTPPGMQWVADRERRIYVRADCEAVARIAPADRYYYTTERGAQADGYRRGDAC